MQYFNGEITISPKVVYWVGIPSILDKNKRLELLKNDILIIEHDGNSNSLYELKKSYNKYTAYFFNLENLLLKNKINNDNIYTFSTNIATFIDNLIPDRSLVHTSLIDDDLANIFRTHGISFLEKNLKDKKEVFSTLNNIIRPFFVEQGRLERSTLRLILLPMKYKVEIRNLSNSIMPVLEGYIKDLSLNGMCFRLSLKSDLSFFQTKERLKLKLFIKHYIVNIDLACIVRLDDEAGDVCVSFNINSERMIKEESSNCLTSLIYNWLINIIKKYGKIEISEKENQASDN
jgi:hypothetical protein